MLRGVLRLGITKCADGSIKVCAVHAPQCALVKHTAVAAVPIIVAAPGAGEVSGSHAAHATGLDMELALNVVKTCAKGECANDGAQRTVQGL